MDTHTEPYPGIMYECSFQIGKDCFTSDNVINREIAQFNYRYTRYALRYNFLFDSLNRVR